MMQIALAETADGSDSEFERRKVDCEDGLCVGVHVSTCVKVRPLVESFRSVGDQRTRNNTMRHNYRALDATEKAQMESIKDHGLDFLRQLHNINGTMTAFDAGAEPPRLTSRELSIAATKIEEAVMWAVKYVTG